MTSRQNQSRRKQLIQIIEQNRIPVDKISEALTITGIFPDNAAWLKFIDRILLWLGSMAIVVSAVFFFAFNWHELDRFTQFGMIELLIILCILFYWKQDATAITAKVALFMASIFLGVLLALFGQIYQTGADPWQLFFSWALLILPWVLMARFPALWILWITLLNLSIVLYFMTFRGLLHFSFNSETSVLWTLFIINTLALFTWELLLNQWHWLAERWAVRLLATASGFSLTWLMLHALFDDHTHALVPTLIWLVWLSVLYLTYRNRRRDLYMLAGMALSVMIVALSFLAKHMLDDLEADGFLLLALLMIAMGTGAAIWLKKIHQSWHQE
jgi:uncharacterized membrane protein